MNASIRSALRAATAEDHTALEATPLMLALTARVPTRAEYLAYLSHQWGLHTVLEHALIPWMPAAWASERLIKRHWLASDISLLLPEQDWAQGLTPIRIDEIRSMAQALGTLYVLEGSTLGLRMLAQRLPSGHPGIQAGRFLHGYGDQHGLRWRTFLDTLETLPAADWPEAIAAAQATFLLYCEQFASASN